MASGSSGSSSSASAGVSADQFSALMAALREGIKDKMVTLKRELSAEREVADEKLVKKLKLDKAPVFRKKGHERQYRHNEEVRLKLVTETRAALDEQPPALEKMRTLIDEGEKIIDERQKHIRIADRSDNGWATVEEYVEDELAENSDDEKRLSRADARATKKLKSAAQKSGKNIKRPGQRKFNNFVSQRGAMFYSGGPGLLNPGSQFGGGLYHAPAVLAPAAQPASSRTGGISTSSFGPCFECGMPGHVRKYCPKLMPGRLGGVTNK